MRKSALYGAMFLLTLGLLGGLAGCGGGQQAQQPAEEKKEVVTQPAPEKPKEQPKEQPKESVSVEDLIEKGKQLAQANGCLGCHTVDGKPSVGPTWKGLYGKEEELQDGTKVTVDEPYLKESIVDPNAKVVKGFSPIMPPYSQLSEEDLKALIEYIKSLK